METLQELVREAVGKCGGQKALAVEIERRFNVAATQQAIEYLLQTRGEPGKGGSYAHRSYLTPFIALVAGRSPVFVPRALRVIKSRPADWDADGIFAQPRPASNRRAIPAEWQDLYKQLLPEERQYVMSLAKMRLRDRGVGFENGTPDERAVLMARRAPPKPDTAKEESDEVQMPQQPALQSALREPDHGARDRQSPGRGKSDARRKPAPASKRPGKKKAL